MVGCGHCCCCGGSIGGELRMGRHMAVAVGIGSVVLGVMLMVLEMVLMLMLVLMALRAVGVGRTRCWAVVRRGRWRRIARRHCSL